MLALGRVARGCAGLRSARGAAAAAPRGFAAAAADGADFELEVRPGPHPARGGRELSLVGGVGQHRDLKFRARGGRAGALIGGYARSRGQHVSRGAPGAVHSGPARLLRRSLAPAFLEE